MKNSKTKIILMGLLTLLVVSTIGIMTFEMMYNDNKKQMEKQQYEIEVSSIGIALLENGSLPDQWNEETRTLLTGMIGERRKI